MDEEATSTSIDRETKSTSPIVDSMAFDWTGKQPHLNLRRALLADFGERTWMEHSNAIDVVLLEASHNTGPYASLNGCWNQPRLTWWSSGRGLKLMMFR